MMIIASNSSLMMVIAPNSSREGHITAEPLGSLPSAMRGVNQMKFCKSEVNSFKEVSDNDTFPQLIHRGYLPSHNCCDSEDCESNGIP